MPTNSVPHESIMSCCNISDDSFTLKLLDSLNGENDVYVSVRVRMVIVIMGDREIANRSGDVNSPERGIPIRVIHVKGLLIPLMNSCGRNECHPALFQGFTNWRPWDSFCLYWGKGFNEPLRQNRKASDKSCNDFVL